MVSRDKLQRQLDRIGCNFRFWGRAEVNELANILMESETIAHCVNGNYEGGFALLCATDHRVLLVDKKPLNYLNIQDFRFEMINEFDYSHRMMNATVHIRTASDKHLAFSSWNQHRLRVLLHYVQQRVIEIRQYQYMAQQFQANALTALQQAAQPAPAAPTYVPNMAANAALESPEMPSAPNFTAAAPAPHETLGAYTYTKLPHFRSRNSRRLGKYATMPDEIYPPLPT